MEQELKGELPRAGHTATEVGRHIIFAGGILLQGRATMDVIILDAANYSMHRSMHRSRFWHTQRTALAGHVLCRRQPRRSCPWPLPVQHD